MKQTTNIETQCTNYHLIWKNQPTVYIRFKAKYVLKLALDPVTWAADQHRLCFHLQFCFHLIDLTPRILFPGPKTQGTFHLSELTGQTIPVAMRISLFIKSIRPDHSNLEQYRRRRWVFIIVKMSGRPVLTFGKCPQWSPQKSGQYHTFLSQPRSG